MKFEDLVYFRPQEIKAVNLSLEPLDKNNCLSRNQHSRNTVLRMTETRANNKNNND
jgi:hypothetical protein